MNEHTQPSDRPFWRRGNEGTPRRKNPPSGYARKRDTRPEAYENADVFARFKIYPDLKDRIIVEKDKQNKSTSSFVRKVIADYFDTEERERRRGAAEAPLKHKTEIGEYLGRGVVLRVYMSPNLKRKIISAARAERTTMSALVRKILHTYFLNLLMKGKK